MKNVTLDWAKMGTLLAVSHWLAGGSITDPDWLRTSTYTLAGYSAYELLGDRLIDTSRFGEFGSTLRESIKVATMFLVGRLLEGGSLTDQAWLRGVGITILGFAIYTMFIRQRLMGQHLTSHPDLAHSINDILHFGVMMVVVHVMSGGDVMSREWQMRVLYMFAGLVAYNLITSRVVSRVTGLDPHDGKLPLFVS